MKRTLSRVCLLLCTLLLMTVFTVGVCAQGDYIDDQADLISDTVEQTLDLHAQRIRTEYGYEIGIVTRNDLAGLLIEDYADNYYENGYYARNAVFLFVDMGSRETWILTNGDADILFDDGDGLEKLFDSFSDDLRNGQYEQAFSAYYNEIDTALALDRDGQSYSDGYVTEHETDYGSRAPTKLVTYIAIGVGVGLVIAGIIFAVCLFGMKTARSKAAAGEYVKPGSFALTHSSDLYLYTTTTRVRIQSNSGSSGRSGGSRGGGGRSF